MDALYLDGNPVPGSLLPFTRQPRLVDSVIVASATSVRAVQASGGKSWLLVADPELSVYSNGSWRCNDVFYPNWFSPGYDASWWLAAETVGPASLTGSPIDTSAASAIWTRSNASSPIYCRLDRGTSLAFTATNTLST